MLIHTLNIIEQKGKMLIFAIATCILALSGLANCEADSKIEVENGVLVLTQANFQSAITDNEFILVEFYAPWCGHCKALAPEFEKAATALEKQGSSIKLGKVDATIEQSLAEQFGVRGYPTLKFFRSGNEIEYNGGRTSDEIISWVTKKTGPAAVAVKSVEEAETLIADNKVIVFGFFKDQESEFAKTFLSVAAGIDEYPFAITDSDDVITKYEAKDGSIVLFKQFDEGKAVFEGEQTEIEIKKFLQAQSMPLIVEFNHESAQKIFGGDIKSHLLLFLSKEAGHLEQYAEKAKDIAKKFRNEVLFVTINADEEEHKRILTFFGMEKEQIPSMRLIRLEDDMAKYKPDVIDLGAESIEKFVQAYLDGKLKQHLLSQDVPEDWDKEPVKVLVSSNFDEVVFNKDADVLVEFYAPWCGHCKQLAPIYDQLGEKFAGNDAVVVAKIDATANELEHTKITSFPTIKLYKKGDNSVVDYNGERTLEALASFIESGGKDSEGVPDVEDVEEDRSQEERPKDEL